MGPIQWWLLFEELLVEENIFKVRSRWWGLHVTVAAWNMQAKTASATCSDTKSEEEVIR